MKIFLESTDLANKFNLKFLKFERCSTMNSPLYQHGSSFTFKMTFKGSEESYLKLKEFIENFKKPFKCTLYMNDCEYKIIDIVDKEYSISVYYSSVTNEIQLVTSDEFLSGLKILVFQDYSTYNSNHTYGSYSRCILYRKIEYKDILEKKNPFDEEFIQAFNKAHIYFNDEEPLYTFMLETHTGNKIPLAEKMNFNTIVKEDGKDTILTKDIIEILNKAIKTTTLDILRR